MPKKCHPLNTGIIIIHDMTAFLASRLHDKINKALSRYIACTLHHNLRQESIYRKKQIGLLPHKRISAIIIGEAKMIANSNAKFIDQISNKKRRRNA